MPIILKSTDSQEHQAKSLVKIVTYSPIFGFVVEADAEDLGPVDNQSRLRRVRFSGEGLRVRHRLVLPELNGVRTDQWKALNELIFASFTLDVCELPCSDVTQKPRKIKLSGEGQR